MDAEQSPRSRMRALNVSSVAKQKMGVASVCAKLGLKETDCLAMFLIGSRLWGTAGFRFPVCSHVTPPLPGPRTCFRVVDCELSTVYCLLRLC
jgi:hypothetical protein